MKVSKFVSIFLICCTVFGIAASNGTGFRISAEVTLPAESDLRMREGTLAIDDPNWLPPEARLTEEEIAALDPPPVTDEEITAEMAANGSMTLQGEAVEPYRDLSALSTMSAASVADGVKQFQQYINANLPMSYLGTQLTVDGSCGPATQTAAIKLIQYRLNQLGAGLAVDGGFGTLTQQAFSNYVGTIERYDSGVWVYILQGLLYCHSYDPGGFDGSYGVSGGTGCLNAVNLFKSVNVITEGGSGTVGIETMKCLVWRAPLRVVDDGVYYIRDCYHARYASVEDGKINGLTEVESWTKNDKPDISRLRQMWKIHYLGNGYYTVRPMHKLNMGLTVHNNKAVINHLIQTDQLWNIPSDMRWTIAVAIGNAMEFRYNGDAGKLLNTPDSGAGTGLNIVSSPGVSAAWILERVDPAPEGLLLYNTSSNSSVSQQLRRYMAPGQTKTLDELYIKTAVYSGNTISQAITWESLDTDRATVNASTGQITAKAPGSVTIRGKKLLSGSYKYVYIDLTVTQLPVGVYRIENRYSFKNIDIENQNMNSGTILHQWQFHRGSTQKWILALRDDGYYVIYSQKGPAYYMGVNTGSGDSAKPVVLRYAPVGNNLQWKIYATAGGAYRVQTRLNSEVLSLESQSTANGTDLRMKSYTADSNYMDEWIFHRLNDYSLFYIGEGSADGYMNPLLQKVKGSLDSSGLSGLASRSGTKTEVLNAMSFSKLFSSVTHGSQTLINLQTGGTLTVNDINALPDDALVNLDLVYFGACKTGAGGVSATNLVNTVYNKGAGAVIGFTVNVDAAACNYWTELFMEEVAGGKTIKQALDTADDVFKDATVFEEDEQTQVSSRLEKGNLYVSIKQ